jgi:hypothetical protein
MKWYFKIAFMHLFITDEIFYNYYTMKKYLLLVLFAATIGWTANAQTEISTAGQLAAIGHDKLSLKGNYILINDITVENWNPIGAVKAEFTGIFDGNGHTITIINVSPVETVHDCNVGLFGTMKKATVKNLRVTGEIAYSTGEKQLDIGGIAGANYGGKIINCISEVNITGEGGIYKTGQALLNMVSRGFAGNISGVFAGGIVAINRGYIGNCYSTGDVSITGAGFKCAGGIVGVNNKVINNCYALGNLKATGSEAVRCVGGIVGWNTSVVENSVALNQRVESAGTTTQVVMVGNSIIIPYNYSGGVIGNNYTLNNQLPVRNTYYRNDMERVRKKIEGGQFVMADKAGIEEDEINEEIEKPAEEPSGKKRSKKTFWEHLGFDRDIDIETLQTQEWWYGKRVGFKFGTDEKTPWVWDNILKHPILYWEKR